tara:strand:- start:385 stop:1053 length:669 start_codon:yes stop_codon:yes gene_type:complete
MEEKLINPYSLLGVNVNSSLRELKKNYYNMALLCHPDRGGDKRDMNVVCLAYNYIKEQLENVNERTYEELEDEFEKFIKEQEIELPKFGQIYEETNDWIVDFNKKFEEQKKIDDTINPLENNPFENGYGEIMDNSEDVELEYKPIEDVENKNKFKRDIIIYEEPEPLPNTISYFPLDREIIDDYSDFGSEIKMTDYKKAFFDPEKFEKVKERDYPKNDIKYQ